MLAKIVLSPLKKLWEHIGAPSGHNRTVAICAIFTLLSAVAYTIFAGKQWLAMQKQLIETQKQTALLHDQLVAAQSPVISYKPTLSEPLTKNLNERDFFITLSNDGNGICPKSTVHFRLSVKTFPQGVTIYESPPYTWEQPQIPAHENRDWMRYGVPSVGKSDEIYDTQTRTMFFEGEYEYDDGFGETKGLISFCYEYVGLSHMVKPGEIASPGGFMPCERIPSLIRELKQYKDNQR